MKNKKLQTLTTGHARMTSLAVLAALTPMLGATAAMADSVTHAKFGTLSNGKTVDEYTMTNAHGMVVKFITLGGCITAIEVPDRNGKLGNVVLGYKTLAGYDVDNTFFGGIIGRYANRIAKGTFTLDGKTYHLPINNGVNSLHGGTSGFNLQMWKVETKTVPDGVAAVLTYTSPDGQDGYPGTMKVQVTYTLEDSNALKINYQATTDKPTVINMTSHDYFNLNGNGSGSALGQLVEINADSYTPTDATQIPTGKIDPVAGTPMDFRTLRPIDSRIHDDFKQLIMARGYDHNWVLNKSKPGEMSFAAEAYAPKTGRIMKVYTTEPGVQFYTGNYLNGTVVGSDGKIYRQGAGYTFETQHYPDSPNHPNFPSTVLNPGQTFNSTTIFKFSTD
ncbi:aldose epimerase family protein [Acidocella aminolytica]|uniref:Aldose 1-epimerase n=1 Tax=Acidocella aminolytica 101 = DSM 11237 TaxID=1120923 RepID=A0A0D6PJE6_9PROT|nr:aldose epimerase family protein [Acidocella aminolytica]GAN81890.1 aldose 1-epimerase [Acidocella aminolytica 101 = DSM 11237]SHF20591.1 aldose 1-epimerase [Acidocella aminolytica 101 = DSM 11237]